MVDIDIRTSAIMSAGMKALRDSLGTVEAEIFIVTLKTKGFDYTEWRKTQPWYNAPIEQILDDAEIYVKMNLPQFEKATLVE